MAKKWRGEHIFRTADYSCRAKSTFIYVHIERAEAGGQRKATIGELGLAVAPRGSDAVAAHRHV